MRQIGAIGAKTLLEAFAGHQPVRRDEERMPPAQLAGLDHRGRMAGVQRLACNGVDIDADRKYPNLGHVPAGL